MSRLHAGGHGRPHGFTRTPRIQPARDLQVSNRIVACPVCSAAVDQGCLVLGTDKPTVGPHRARRRLALRTMREADST